MGPVFHGAGLNITAMSHQRRIHVGLIACPESVPDVDELVERFPAELAALRTAAGATRADESGRSEEH